jgi:hypothetical protein
MIFYLILAVIHALFHVSYKSSFIIHWFSAGMIVLLLLAAIYCLNKSEK